MERKVLVDILGCLTRVALLEDGDVVEVSIESEETARMTGNIYLGRVSNILPGMQAAFLDIGLSRDAFLHVSDAAPNGFDPDSVLLKHDKTGQGSGQADITEKVTPGEFMLVQMKREPMPMKGARVTAHIMLPGRYIVLMPTVQHIGVSKRIHSETERHRLQEVVRALLPEGMGAIVRTAAEGQRPEDFESDIRELLETWADILRRSKKSRTPGCLHCDLDPALRILRDIFEEAVTEVLIESDELFEACREFVSGFAPQWTDRVKRYDDPVPLFERYGVEKALKHALQRKVWLPSGGYVIIDYTEALVAIDVNTGRYAGKSDLEDTVFRTNLEAADVIARQVRLRNIGGIIVIDFIDMHEPSHREEVLKRLREAFGRDRSPVNISSFSSMGLVELTRKRSGPSLDRILLQLCPHCKGSGHILHPQTVATRVEQGLTALPHRGETGGFVTVVVHPSVTPYLDCRLKRLRSHVKNKGYRFRLIYDSAIWPDVYKINVT